VTGSFARFVALSIDAQGYGKAHDQDQLSIQDELLDILAAAAAAAGLDRRTWHRQGQGDGELALITAGEPDTETRVVDGFVRELAVVLFRRNCDRAAEGRFRLRLAVDHGLVRPASNGFAGRPVVVVSRLVGCRPLRQAMAAAPDANLAVILSRQVYTDLVLGGHTTLRPADFRRVSVSEKELTDQAWLRVPGVDVNRLRITPDPVTRDGLIQHPATRDGITEDTAAHDGIIEQPAGPEGGRPIEGGPLPRRDLPAAARGGQVVVNEFTGAVDARHGVIGIRNDR
jgi:hypothetical protein